jgi:hypothetical protein
MLTEGTNRGWGVEKDTVGGHHFNGNKEGIMGTAPFWVITQQVVVISYRRFGATYRSHLKGPRIKVLNP